MTQKAVLFAGSIRDNVYFGESEAPADDEGLAQAVELSQAKEFVDKLPDGTQHHVAQMGRNMSGGQKQRLSIARALARKPEILVFEIRSPLWTTARMRSCARGYPSSCTTRRRSSSRSASAPSATRTRSSCSTAARPWASARMKS